LQRVSPARARSHFHLPTPRHAAYVPRVRFQKASLIGVGLLGGSLGLALRKRRLATHVEGFVRRDSSVSECEQLGVVHRASRDLAAVVRNADLVVLCTPLAQMTELTRCFAPHLKPGALVTDVGSVKGVVVRELEPLIAAAGAHFVGSHPMAGGEQTGPAAARADLFQDATCIVTPAAGTAPSALKLTEELWQKLGGRLLRVSPEFHDELVARCSHLPHVLAAALVNYVLSPAHPPEQAQVCATGFRDTTRIASGSPEMWRDIAMANREKLAAVLGAAIEDLQDLRRALRAGDSRTLEEFFEVAKLRRDAWAAPNGLRGATPARMTDGE
jgi:prephenate dehydrogenase